MSVDEPHLLTDPKMAQVYAALKWLEASPDYVSAKYLCWALHGAGDTDNAVLVARSVEDSGDFDVPDEARKKGLKECYWDDPAFHEGWICAEAGRLEDAIRPYLRAIRRPYTVPK